MRERESESGNTAVRVTGPSAESSRELKGGSAEWAGGNGFSTQRRKISGSNGGNGKAARALWPRGHRQAVGAGGDRQPLRRSAGITSRPGKISPSETSLRHFRFLFNLFYFRRQARRRYASRQSRLNGTDDIAFIREATCEQCPLARQILRSDFTHKAHVRFRDGGMWTDQLNNSWGQFPACVSRQAATRSGGRRLG